MLNWGQVQVFVHILYFTLLSHWQKANLVMVLSSKMVAWQQLAPAKGTPTEREMETSSQSQGSQVKEVPVGEWSLVDLLHDVQAIIMIMPIHVCGLQVSTYSSTFSLSSLSVHLLYHNHLTYNPDYLQYHIHIWWAELSLCTVPADLWTWPGLPTIMAYDMMYTFPSTQTWDWTWAGSEGSVRQLINDYLGLL